MSPREHVITVRVTDLPKVERLLFYLRRRLRNAGILVVLGWLNSGVYALEKGGALGYFAAACAFTIVALSTWTLVGDWRDLHRYPEPRPNDPLEGGFTPALSKEENR